MKQRINIAEILKDCPKDMELDCTMYEDVYFDYVDELNIIHCYIQHEMYKTSLTFNQHGTPNSDIKSKCVIFPKGKTTWEGFHRPFKDGDILSYQYKDFKNRTIYIYMQHSRMNTTYYVALSGGDDSKFMVNDKEGYALNGYEDSVRLATEEEKSKLFQAIKDNGYHWNDETKTLEELVEPKFKVGDKIKLNSGSIIEISEINNYFYISTTGWKFYIKNQDTYELVPNKFDINTLKPFESKVLVRDNKLQKWAPAMWGYYDFDSQDYPYKLVGGAARYCIPYEGNKHLLGTTDDCDDFYKTW